jgi:hypothetical protein
VIYSLVFFTLCLLNLRLCLEKIRRHYLLIFFIAAYLIVHLLAVAWYTPIAKGNRFILAYFLPYMFVLFYVLRSTDRFFGGQANRLLTTVNFIVLVVLTGHIYYIMSERIATFYGGL